MLRTYRPAQYFLKHSPLKNLNEYPELIRFILTPGGVCQEENAQFKCDETMTGKTFMAKR